MLHRMLRRRLRLQLRLQLQLWLGHGSALRRGCSAQTRAGPWMDGWNGWARQISCVRSVMRRPMRLEHESIGKLAGQPVVVHDRKTADLRQHDGDKRHETGCALRPSQTITDRDKDVDRHRWRHSLQAKTAARLVILLTPCRPPSNTSSPNPMAIIVPITLALHAKATQSRFPAAPSAQQIAITCPKRSRRPSRMRQSTAQRSPFARCPLSLPEGFFPALDVSQFSCQAAQLWAG
jgi:hypothetical protein